MPNYKGLHLTVYDGLKTHHAVGDGKGNAFVLIRKDNSFELKKIKLNVFAGNFKIRSFLKPDRNFSRNETVMRLKKAIENNTKFNSIDEFINFAFYNVRKMKYVFEKLNTSSNIIFVLGCGLFTAILFYAIKELTSTND